MNFEIVLGLEVHCELKTKSKMFSGAPVTFGKGPNTCVNEIDFGYTGTLPALNKKGVELALRACTALNMEIDEVLHFDRKNYYYSDLPKGYQITQDRRPIGKNGYIDIEADGQTLRVDIERLHMEEDTAKQTHLDSGTLIDYNRAGIPLIEIVTRPVLRSGAQAAAYLEKLRSLLIYTNVSDAKMEEGSLRCDVNISLRPFGSDTFGTRCEIKNLNSISNVQKAIEFEASRQEKILITGGFVIQETRRFDEALKETVLMREKGDAVDYRYYPEPNILPIRLDKNWIKSVQDNMSELPEQRKKRYITEFELPEYDATILIANKEVSDYFDLTVKHTTEYKLVANWLMSDVSQYLNKEGIRICDTKMTPEYLAKMVNLVADNSISGKQAKTVLEIMLVEGKNPDIIIEENGMKQLSNKDDIIKLIHIVFARHPEVVEEIKAGNDRKTGFLVGQVMKESKGQANPGLTNQLVVEELKR